jgi:hypothetical protein
MIYPPSFHNKMILNVRRRLKNIYTGLKILKMLTNINPLYVKFVIDLLLEQKRFTICQRITSVLIPKDFPWKVTKDTIFLLVRPQGHHSDPTDPYLRGN